MLAERDYRWICGALGIPRGGILSVAPNPNSGMNNDTFVVDTVRGPVLYRIAGQGTERFCSRTREKDAYERLACFGLTDQLLACDPDTGAKLTVYHPGSRTCDPHNPDDCRRAMALLRKLHGLPVRLQGRDEPLRRLGEYLEIAREAGSALGTDPEFLRVRAGVEALSGEFDCPEEMLRPVHADALPGNYLFRPDGPDILIDLEFASMGCIYGDLADFAHDADLDEEACLNLLTIYFGRAPTREEVRAFYAYCACVALMWSAWAAYKAQTEPSEAEFFRGYCARSVRFARTALNLRLGQG